MDRQGDSASFGRELDRHITGNYGEDSVYQESAENEYIGELVKMLLQWGEVRVCSGFDTDTAEDGYYVEARDEWSTVSCWDADLVHALERVHADVSKVANYS